MSAFKDFLKQNATGGNAAFSALGNIDDLTSSDRKLQGVLKTLKDMALWSVTMRAALASAYGGMGKAVRTLAGEMGMFSNALKKVREEYTKAQEKMAKGIAAPFEREEIENTKKMTKAMEAMVPVVSRLAKTYHAIYGGVSTFKAKMAETVATSRIGRAAIESFGTALAVIVPLVSAVSMIKLGATLKNLGAAMGDGAGFAAKFGAGLNTLSGGLISSSAGAYRASQAFNVMKGALRFSGVFATAAVVGTVITGIVSLHQSVKAARKEMALFAAENTRANNAMNAQISAIDTMADKYAALASALEAATDARNKFKEANQDRSIIGWITGTDQAKINLNKANVAARDAAVLRARNAPTEKDRSSEILLRDISEQSRKQDFENRLSRATPEEQRVMLAEEAARTGDLASKGLGDIAAQSSSSEYLGKLTNAEMENRAAIKAAEARLAASYANGTEDTSFGSTYGPLGPLEAQRIKNNAETTGKIASDKAAIKAAQDNLVGGAKVRQDTMINSGSDVLMAQAELDKITAARSYQEAKARGKTGSGEAKRQRELDMAIGKAVGGNYIGMSDESLMQMQAAAKSRLEMAQKTAEDTPANRQAAEQRKEELRISKVNASLTRQDASLGLQGQAAEGRGDYEEADRIRLATDSAKRALDLESSGLGSAEARAMAGAELYNSINLQQRQGNMAADAAAAVSSMARVGGGGGVEEVQNDLLGVAQRHLEVSARMEQILNDIRDTKIGIKE